jgi:hypothetical protein
MGTPDDAQLSRAKSNPSTASASSIVARIGQRADGGDHNATTDWATHSHRNVRIDDKTTLAASLSAASKCLDIDFGVHPQPDDKGTPDEGISRSKALVRLTGRHPLNAESPAAALIDVGLITPSVCSI